VVDDRPGNLVLHQYRRAPCPKVDRGQPELCRDVDVNEFVEDDVNKFRVLARRSLPVGILSHATGGLPERSQRYRSILGPFGFEHELRLALIEDGACWGALMLIREPTAPDFTPAEAATLAKLRHTLAEGVRIGLLHWAVDIDTGVDGPGLVVLDEDYRIIDTTPAAECWLAELDRGPWGPPEAVMAVAQCVGRLDIGSSGESVTPRARVRTRSGRWLVIHGSRLRQASGHLCVIVEDAKRAEIAPLLIAAYGFSQREAQLTRLIPRDSPPKRWPQLLLSMHTVQDHFKSIFERVGVRSRRELVARIFDQYRWTR
jgi:hypothetical protein